jgi:hypothetical protein
MPSKNNQMNDETTIDESAFPVGQVFMNRWDAVLAGFVGQSPSPYADVYKRILSSPAPESRGQS